ncbi:glycosyltransferase [Tautonia sp. JC769]|uniref:glycosyltransferase n=1 Tax=Tautonia sp. JC769 TaxID=3232135 RepID=UPI003458F9FC
MDSDRILKQGWHEMNICVITRSLDPSIPALAMARELDELGHRVAVLLAPLHPDAMPPESDEREPGGPVVHRLEVPRWLGRLGGRRVRRLAMARVLRRLDPEVVHLADDGDRGVAVPSGAVVLLSAPGALGLRRGDAVVTPDGRFFDRSGVLLECPGVPPMPKAQAVTDGLDPDVSASQWRVLTYLAGVDQVRRSRRVRLDRPHGGVAPRPVRSPRRSLRDAGSLGAVGTA